MAHNFFAFSSFRGQCGEDNWNHYFHKLVRLASKKKKKAKLLVAPLLELLGAAAAEPREFQKLLHGFIGGADEQAPQFLQERRMDGDVKIPI